MIRLIRLALGAIGLALLGYGAYQLLHNSSVTRPAEVAKWLVVALIVHDGVIAWVVVVVGWLIARVVPPRARAYVQGGLICAALITLIALPLIYRRGKAEPGLTLLTQNYPAHLAVLLGMVAAGTAAAYAVRVARDRAGRSTANDRPPTDQSSTTT
jgi:hypothetical protein